MNKKFPFIFLIFIFISCNPKNEKQIDKDVEIINIVDFVEEKKSDTIQESNYYAIFDKKTGKNSKLTKDEIEIVNSNLEKVVNKYNDEIKIEGQKINLRYYFRQYIISVDQNGDKIVRVFCFCSYSGNWKNEIMMVHDGGDCFLNAIINITKNKTEYFGTNGLA